MDGSRRLCLALVTLGLVLVPLPAEASPLQSAGGTRAVAFCPGDQYCPCGNDNPSSAGCRNSTGFGATLSATGNAWVLADSLTLTVRMATPNEFGIFLQNVSWATATPTYNGLRCLPINSHLVRHYAPPAVLPTVTDSIGMGVNAQPMTVGDFLGDTQPGVTVYYQFWYRDNPGYGSTCTHGANFSNGLSLTWSLGPDGMVQVPGGDFVMGCHVGTGSADQYPLHDVTLGAFWMDVLEVTNLEYRDYLNAVLLQGLISISGGVVYQAGAGGEMLFDTDSASSPSRIFWTGTSFQVEGGKEHHPVVEVSWYGAVTYANWKSWSEGLAPCYDTSTWICTTSAGGYRLPTEAEWECAARGGEHLPYYAYPWGDVLSGSCANYMNSGDPYETGVLPWTTPVGYYDGAHVPPGADMANGYGLYDMTGNVSEWCHDWYDAAYYTVSPAVDPTGPASGWQRVARGGGYSSGWVQLRSAFRYPLAPYYRENAVGFRLVR